ncbi:MAG: 8-oxoguanine deaminase [Treponema sp.]|jgi:cytosine/adenosine deaminase-related metal-dependent hydrolase|nr:8-oxoguanine deaminase [Treponema sp.]
MALTLIQNAAAIVTIDDADRVLHNASILIRDGVITAAGQNLSVVEDAEVIDATGCWIYPGLVNTHHHLYQTLTRGLPFVQNMELFSWLRSLYEIWRGLDDEAVYYSALTGMGELAKYGCTTVMDHHYVFPRGRSNHFIERQFEAAAALGLRLCAARGSMSRGRKDGGLPPDDLTQDVDVILEDCERLVQKFHDPSPFSFRQMVLAPCSPFSVSGGLLRETASLARRLGVRLHTHLCETKDEENYCLEKEGMRPLAYMETCGWLGEDVWFAHGIHFNDDELPLLARTKTGVAHCPVSNMKLASGVCRVPEMLALGVPLGLAVDGSASNDCSNLLAEIRAAYLLHRLSRSGKAPSGYNFLQMATRGSAALLGRTDIGFLAPGMAADMFALDVDLLELAGSGCDPHNMPAVLGYSRPAKWVMAGGKIIAHNGTLSGIDEAETRIRANTAALALLQKAGISR